MVASCRSTVLDHGSQESLAVEALRLGTCQQLIFALLVLLVVLLRKFAAGKRILSDWPLEDIETK